MKERVLQMNKELSIEVGKVLSNKVSLVRALKLSTERDFIYVQSLIFKKIRPLIPQQVVDYYIEASKMLYVGVGYSTLFVYIVPCFRNKIFIIRVDGIVKESDEVEEINFKDLEKEIESDLSWFDELRRKLDAK